MKSREETMKNIKNQAASFRHNRTRNALTFIVVAISGLFLLMGHSGILCAQPTPSQSTPQEAILSGTLYMYLVTLYGDSL